MTINHLKCHKSHRKLERNNRSRKLEPRGEGGMMLDPRCADYANEMLPGPSMHAPNLNFNFSPQTE
jgi:hypothetical protein